MTDDIKDKAQKAVHNPIVSALMAGSLALGGPSLYKYLDDKFTLVIDKIDDTKETAIENEVRVNSIQTAMEREHEAMMREHQYQDEKIQRLYDWVGNIQRRQNER